MEAADAAGSRPRDVSASTKPRSLPPPRSRTASVGDTAEAAPGQPGGSARGDTSGMNTSPARDGQPPRGTHHNDGKGDVVPHQLEPASAAGGGGDESRLAAAAAVAPPSSLDPNVDVFNFLHRSGMVQHARRQVLYGMGQARRAQAEVDELLTECTFTPRVHHRVPEETVHRRVEEQRQRLAGRAPRIPGESSSSSNLQQHHRDRDVVDSTTTASNASQYPHLGLWSNLPPGAAATTRPHQHTSPSSAAAHDVSLATRVREHNQQQHRPTAQHQTATGDNESSVVAAPAASPRRAGDAAHHQRPAGNKQHDDSAAAPMDDLLSPDGSVLVPPTTRDGAAASHRLYQDHFKREFERHQRGIEHQMEQDAELEQYRREGRRELAMLKNGGDDPYSYGGDDGLIDSPQRGGTTILVDGKRVPRFSAPTAAQEAKMARGGGNAKAQAGPRGRANASEKPALSPRPNARRGTAEVDEMVRTARERLRLAEELRQEARREEALRRREVIAERQRARSPGGRRARSPRPTHGGYASSSDGHPPFDDGFQGGEVPRFAQPLRRDVRDEVTHERRAPARDADGDHATTTGAMAHRRSKSRSQGAASSSGGAATPPRPRTSIPRAHQRHHVSDGYRLNNASSSSNRRQGDHAVPVMMNPPFSRDDDDSLVPRLTLEEVADDPYALGVQ